MLARDDADAGDQRVASDHDTQLDSRKLLGGEVSVWCSLFP